MGSTRGSFRAWVSVVCAAALTVPAGCGPGKAAEAMLSTPEVDLGGGGTCPVNQGGSAPYVVEWSASDRARLESSLKDGIVGVRYTGCELELLNRCNAPGEYAYKGVTPKSESKSIANEDELFANLPRGALQLKGELERAGSLSVDMMVVGRREAPPVAVFERGHLVGDCARATHVITGLTVGAFRLHTGAEASLDASVDVQGVGGAGAGSKASKQSLSSDGDVTACKSAKSGDPSPPLGCGANMRIELQALAGQEMERAEELADMRLLDKRAPWRKQIVYGGAAMGVGVVGMGLLMGGFIVANDGEREVEDILEDDPNNLDARRTALQKNSLGNGLVITGGILFGVGWLTGATLFALGAKQKLDAKRDVRRARRNRASVGATPGGLEVRF